MSDMQCNLHLREREPHNYRIENCKSLLTDYRYALVNTLCAEDLIQWLRANEVLDREDEEIILSNTTSVMKAGKLIDMVEVRGSRDFNFLMEFMEYQHPPIYEKMTNSKARQPDKKIFNIRRKSSKFKEDVSKIMKPILSEHKDTIQGAVEMKIDEIQNELEMRDAQIADLIQKVLEVAERNKDLLQQGREAETERCQIVNQQDILRRERDSFVTKVMELVDEKWKNSFENVSFKKKDGSDALKRLREENAKYKSELENLKKPQSRTDEVTRLRDENETLRSDNKALSDQLSQWAEACDLAESSIQEYREQMKTLKEERDTRTEQHECLKQKSNQLQQTNNKLNLELENIRSDLRIYENETRMRPRLPPMIQYKCPGCRGRVKRQNQHKTLENEFKPYNHDNDGSYSADTDSDNALTPSPVSAERPELLRENHYEPRRDNAVLRQISREQELHHGESSNNTHKGASFI